MLVANVWLGALPGPFVTEAAIGALTKLMPGFWRAVGPWVPPGGAAQLVLLGFAVAAVAVNLSLGGRQPAPQGDPAGPHVRRALRPWLVGACAAWVAASDGHEWADPHHTPVASARIQPEEENTWQN